MIKRIYIDNYKCLVNFELKLQETVLLLGANGSGKTAVLNVMYAIHKLLAGDIKIDDRLAFHPSTVTRWQTGHIQVVELDVEVGGYTIRYRLEIEHDEKSRRARVVEESLFGDGRTLFRFALGQVHLYKDDGSEGPVYGADWSESALARVAAQPPNTLVTMFMKVIRDVVVCGITPTLLQAVTQQEEAHLDRHAENFVDWYRNALQEDPLAVSRHIEALQPVIDGFKSIRLQQTGPDARVLMLEFAQADCRYRLRFDELSDGQRALVVLYAFLYLGDHRGGGIWLFLDEPENYVALAEIQPWLMALVELCEETPSQAVICSHHPELIDYLGPDSGLMLRREVSGVTTVRRLADLASDNGLKLSESVARGWI